MDDAATRARADFDRVTELNEASKALLTRSFQVNLLALDAMVQSKRGGTSLRGFDEVSSQMRGWSRELHVELERLGELSGAILSLVSLACKSERILQLLAQAAASSSDQSLGRVLASKRREHAALRHEIQRKWRSVAGTLGDLSLLGMMATVLSRSAMIEAASGSAQQRIQLGDVSRQFAQSSEAVVTVLGSLTTRIKRSLTP